MTDARARQPAKPQEADQRVSQSVRRFTRLPLAGGPQNIRTTTGFHTVLQLQSAAGNAAIAGLLAQRGGDANRRAPVQLLNAGSGAPPVMPSRTTPNQDPRSGALKDEVAAKVKAVHKHLPTTDETQSAAPAPPERKEEMTHVVQQRAVTLGRQAARPGLHGSPLRARPVTPVIQRQPESNKPPVEADQPATEDRRVTVSFFDRDGNKIASLPFERTLLIRLPLGIYPATLTSTTITVAGQPPEGYSFEKPQAAALINQASSFVVAITDSSLKIKSGKQPSSIPPVNKPGEKDDGGGTGQPGSEFGWLGLFNLPAPVVKALEAVLKALGNAEEMRAIRDLLMAFKELADNRVELSQLFTSEKLLNVVLGLDTSPGLNTLETWAMSAPQKRPKARSGKHKGLAALAVKLLKVVDALRRVLRPIFRARTGFTTAVGLVATGLEEVPFLEEVLGASAEERRQPGFQQLLDSIVDDISRSAQEALAGAHKSVDLVAANLAEQDFVTYEELAQAVTQAALNAVPKLYKPVVWVAAKVGLIEAIGENIIAPLLPKETLEVINGLIRSALEGLAPLIKEVTDGIGEVLAGIEAEVKTSLGPELKVLLIQRTPLASSAGVQRHPSDHIETRLATSSSRPQEAKFRQNSEYDLGQALGDTRVHTDAAAAGATEDLRAKAVIVGRDIYSGSDRFDPGSPEGLHRPAHGATHVVQQINAANPEQVQRDPKDDAKKNLGKTVTSKALAMAKDLVSPSAETLERGAQIAMEVKHLIDRKRKVVSRTNPRLPADAYTYIQDRKTGALVGIRRRLKFVRVPDVPKLKITSTGLIAESLSEKLDPIK